MPIEVIADREDILAAVENWTPNPPPTLVGQWGIFKHNRLVPVRGFWTFASRGRAITKRRQLIEDYSRASCDINFNQQQCITITVFNTVITLRQPISVSNFRWIYPIGDIDRSLLQELLNLFEVRQLTANDVELHVIHLGFDEP